MVREATTLGLDEAAAAAEEGPVCMNVEGERFNLFASKIHSFHALTLMTEVDFLLTYRNHKLVSRSETVSITTTTFSFRRWISGSSLH